MLRPGPAVEQQSRHRPLVLLRGPRARQLPGAHRRPGRTAARVARAHVLAKKIKAGVVWINCFNEFDNAAPFGGYKESGYGREGGSLGIKDDIINAGGTWVDEPAFRDGSQVWGRVVDDIPDFCRELVAALTLPSSH